MPKRKAKRKKADAKAKVSGARMTPSMAGALRQKSTKIKRGKKATKKGEI